MAGDDGADVKNSTRAFRWWFDAARYAVALVVTVVIVTVIAEAIAVVLRPEELRIWVRRGAVAVERNNSTRELTFDFTVKFTNPSGRARIYYTDLKMYFYGRPGAVAAASSNAAKYFLGFPYDKYVDVKPQSTVFSFVHFNYTVNLAPFFHALYDNDSGIADAMLTVIGNVTVEVYGHNSSQVTTLYYCKPVTVAVDTSEVLPDDTMCTKDPPAEGAITA